jgi:hypothetical protein
MLARLGETEPAAVLSGAFAAHLLSAQNENEQTATCQTQALARHTPGEAAYDAAAGRGAAMDEDEIAGYAVSELQRVTALLTEPRAQVPHAPPGPGVRSAGNDCRSAAPGMTPARPRPRRWPRSGPGSGRRFRQ